MNPGRVAVTGSAACSCSEFPVADGVLRSFLTILDGLPMRFLYGHAAIPNFREADSAVFPQFCHDLLLFNTVEQFFTKKGLQKLQCFLPYRCPQRVR